MSKKIEERESLEELANAILETVDQDRQQRQKTLALPDETYIFPLTRRPFFPGMAAPVAVDKGKFYDTLKLIAQIENRTVGLLLMKNEHDDVFKVRFKDMYEVGVIARIIRIVPQENGGAQIILNLEKRFAVTQVLEEEDYLKAKILILDDIISDEETVKATSQAIIATIKDLLKLGPHFKDELQIFLNHADFTEPGKLADFAASLTSASRTDLQGILETIDVAKRLESALVLMKKEHDLSVLQHSINQKIDSTIARTQKDFFLREQLKTIKKELGLEKEEKTLDREKFEGRLKERKVPEDVQAVIQEEMNKLSMLETHSSEYGVVRNYVDWLTTIPWGMFSPENHDLKQAAKILDEDHYGLEDIKKRILEFISVGKLTGGLKGSIICLVGPPGVGKTSIGKSVARALNRKFYRFSVGGMRDEAEIKGHRRTYIGAMPGKIIQALKYCKTMNPVIMLDEIDKMGNSYHGDPASALLEVLDPEQNAEFLDHYLDVRCDLSNVLFIVTANVLDSIPLPLRDRMDILRLSGYIQEEKIQIAQKYLIPRHRKEMGLKTKHVAFNKEAVRSIINGYAREAGVRNLESQIKKIMRKIAVDVVSDMESDPPVEPKKATISEKNLKDFLGKPVFTTDRFYESTPIGVCTGLAWTAMGGATLYIESTKVLAEKTDMKLTGQAGSVMKESAEIAWTYLHSRINQYAPEHTFFEKAQVHIHIPEGATPKDGPSAGITMVTSLLSLLLNKPVLENLGMTGELTLTGRILAIGGVKEKLVAAKRSGLTIIILPKDNLRDYEELPDYLKKGLTVHFVEHYDEVFKIAFPKED